MAARLACVLVVDDDSAIREALVTLLQDEGYRTQEAATGLDALTVLRESAEPLVALLDLLMPVMSGFELLSQIAGDQALASRHRYIVMSARPYRRAIQLGQRFERLIHQLDVGFIEKPFDIDELLRVVRAASAELPGSQPSPQPHDEPDGSQTA